MFTRVNWALVVTDDFCRLEDTCLISSVNVSGQKRSPLSAKGASQKKKKDETHWCILFRRRWRRCPKNRPDKGRVVEHRTFMDLRLSTVLYSCKETIHRLNSFWWIEHPIWLRVAGKNGKFRPRRVGIGVATNNYFDSLTSNGDHKKRWPITVENNTIAREYVTASVIFQVSFSTSQ